VNVISHKKQNYAVWYGGSLLASTVRALDTLGARPLANRGVHGSPSFTAIVTPRPTTRSMVRASSGASACLVAASKSRKEGNCNLPVLLCYVIFVAMARM
jgi:carotenoid cleavage dioxygenase-like enzyme